MQDQIEAQQQHECLLRVSSNSELLQTTARKHRSYELDRVERYLNQKLDFSDWLGIRVYEPEREIDGGVVWHLRHETRRPS